LAKFIRDRLLGKKFLRREFFQKKPIEKIIEEHQRGIRSWSAAIWTLLMFDEWCRIWWD